MQGPQTLPCPPPFVLLLAGRASLHMGRRLCPHIDWLLHVPQGGCGPSGSRPGACVWVSPVGLRGQGWGPLGHTPRVEVLEFPVGGSVAPGSSHLPAW